MYVHVGENVMIRSNEIVAILDKDTVNTSEDIQVLLEKKKDLVSVLASGSFKSLVLTVSQIYLSPIAPTTLKKRLMASNGHELIFDI
jgi:hypothetical protein